MEKGIATKDLTDFKQQNYSVYPSLYIGTDELELRIMLRGGFEVWHNGACVISTDIPRIAVKWFNKLAKGQILC